jgi:hypothetical protein
LFKTLTFNEFDRLCIVTDLPTPSPLSPPEYTDTGKAYRKAMAAKNISMQTRKFWYPAEMVPGKKFKKLIEIF